MYMVSVLAAPKLKLSFEIDDDWHPCMHKAMIIHLLHSIIPLAHSQRHLYTTSLHQIQNKDCSDR